jgi:hypothetical protein
LASKVPSGTIDAVPAAKKLKPALSKAPKPAPKKIAKMDGHIVSIY